MVSVEILQAAIMARLKAYASLTLLTSDLRELGYQGTDFTYPNVRLAIQNQVADRECDTLSVVTFSLFAYSDASSSKMCSTVINAARLSLNQRKLTDVDTPERFVGLRMIQASMRAPQRVSTKVWRADVHFTVKVSEA